MGVYGLHVFGVETLYLGTWTLISLKERVQVPDI